MRARARMPLGRASLLGAAALIATVLPSPPAAGQTKPPAYTDKMNLLTYVDATGTPRAVRSAEDWQVRRGHILASMQLVMGTLPDVTRKVPPAVKTLEEVHLPKVTRRKITFAVEKGDRVGAYLLIPRDAKGKAPAVLCLHQTALVGKAEPAGVGGQARRPYALELARRGYVALTPDYPSLGEYKIDPYKLGYVSCTMKGIWNHMRAVDLLASLPQVDGGRIGCLGHSLGGHNSLFVAAFDARIKAVVTSCGFNRFAKYYGGDLTGWAGFRYMPRIATVYAKDPAKMPFDFTEVLAALAPRAVFVNAPLNDTNFEVSGVRDCVAAAAPVYKLLGAADNLVAVYPDAGHDFPPKVRQAAYEFLDRALRSRKGDATKRPASGAEASP